YVSPYFEAAKEPSRIYDLSRGIADIVRGMGDSAFDSRLASLWEEDANFRRRCDLFLNLEAALDVPNAIEPAASLVGEPIDLFPGGEA
ncbi:MAG TPA: hypothetical protein VJ400_08350, partial [Thermoplasmata archaeon]|nr:hypothetical protein [Thermoplasmata archaeon]